MEITLGLNLKDALILKHGLEHRMESKKKYLDELIYIHQDAEKIEKVSKDLREERKVFEIIDMAIEKRRRELSSIQSRKMEIRNYAVNLGNRLDQVYKADAELNSRYSEN